MGCFLELVSPADHAHNNPEKGSVKTRLHPNLTYCPNSGDHLLLWKRHAKESLPDVFAKKTSRGATDREAEVKALHAKIGQLAVENDFLSKAFGR